MLIERYKLTADRAWQLLRRTSQDADRPLAALAAELVEAGSAAGLTDRDRWRP